MNNCYPPVNIYNRSSIQIYRNIVGLPYQLFRSPISNPLFAHRSTNPEIHSIMSSSLPLLNNRNEEPTSSTSEINSTEINKFWCC